MDAGLKPVVKAEHITFRYAPVLGGTGTIALHDVTVEIYAGDVFGLIGPNGAGKTTLVRLILGLLPLQAGTVHLWDSDKAIAGPSRNRRVGYVPEKVALYDFLTAEELLNFHARLLGLSRDQRHQEVRGLLEEFALAAHAQRRIGTYSKGMHQRLAVAQALLGDPQLLILDEPTDGLDPIGQSEVLALLESLKRAGKTILINSHQLHEIEKLCNRYALLVEGRIASMGSMEEIRGEAQEGRSLEDFFPAHSSERALMNFAAALPLVFRQVARSRAFVAIHIFLWLWFLYDGAQPTGDWNGGGTPEENQITVGTCRFTLRLWGAALPRQGQQSRVTTPSGA